MYTINELRVMNGYAALPETTFSEVTNDGVYYAGGIGMEVMNVRTWSPTQLLWNAWKYIDSTVRAVDFVYDRSYVELIVYEILERARIHFKLDFDIERELKVTIVDFENRFNRSVKVEALSEIGNTFIDQLNDLETQVELMDWHK